MLHRAYVTRMFVATITGSAATAYYYYYYYYYYCGAHSSVVFMALSYKPEGRRFETQ
jgi:hypothetical protein